MDALAKFFNDITSWYWWISVVVVGLGINLASAYIKPAVDRWYVRLSERKRLSSEAERAAFNAKVELLVASPFFLVIEALEELRERTRVLYFFGAALVLFGFHILAKRVPVTQTLVQTLLLLVTMAVGLWAYAIALSLLTSVGKRADTITAAKKALMAGRGSAP